MKPILIYTYSAYYSASNLDYITEYFTLKKCRTLRAVKSSIKTAEVLITSLEFKYTKDLLKKAKSLKYIVTNTTGIDHINLPADSNIKIISLSNSKKLKDIKNTAELAIGLTYAVIRNFRININNVINGKWDRDYAPGLSISGKKVGVIGMGRLGSIYASYCKNMGATVSYYDPKVNIKKYRKYKKLESIFINSDIISIHCRLNDVTNNMVNYNLFRKSKNGFFLINTSRGEILNEQDLIKGLNKKLIHGAGLDVLCNEQNKQFLKKSLILKHNKIDERLIILPHIGGAGKDAREKVEKIVLNELINEYN